jgi:hypothetical protein
MACSVQPHALLLLYSGSTLALLLLYSSFTHASLVHRYGRRRAAVGCACKAPQALLRLYSGFTQALLMLYSYTGTAAGGLLLDVLVKRLATDVVTASLLMVNILLYSCFTHMCV